MKTVTRYMANDGKVFNSRKECKDYELKKFSGIKNIKFFDREGKPYENVEHYFYRIYKDFTKVIIPTKEDYKELVDIIKKEGYYSYHIPSEGTWYRIKPPFNEEDDWDYSSEVYSEKDYKEYIEYLQSLLLVK